MTITFMKTPWQNSFILINQIALEIPIHVKAYEFNSIQVTTIPYNTLVHTKHPLTSQQDLQTFKKYYWCLIYTKSLIILITI